MKWIAAAILAGALIIAATIVATRPAGPEVIETESAVEALSYAEVGWRCEGLSGGDYRPAPLEVLNIYADTETAFGEPVGAGSPEADFRCTEQT
jgi:hypothetical protein